MRDILLQCAGWLAIATSLAHGVLGETKVFARASIEPKQLATLIHGVWQAGTVAWIGRGALMAAAPGWARMWRGTGSSSRQRWCSAPPRSATPGPCAGDMSAGSP